jgi:hypothetical protein
VDARLTQDGQMGEEGEVGGWVLVGICNFVQ